jgi:hypothetical protein
MGFGIVGVKTDSVAKLGRGLQPLLMLHRAGESAVGLASGIEADGFAVFRNRFIQRLLFLQRGAQAVVSVSIAGIEANGLAELGNRFIQLSSIREREAQIVVRFGIVGISADGLGKRGGRFIQFISIPQRDARIRVGVGLTAGDGLLNRTSRDT